MTFFACGNAAGSGEAQYYASDHILEYTDEEYLCYKQTGYTPSIYDQEEDNEQE